MSSSGTITVATLTAATVNTAVLQLTSLSTTGSVTAASVVASGALTAGSGLVTVTALTSSGSVTASGNLRTMGSIGGLAVLGSIGCRTGAAETPITTNAWNALVSYTLAANTLTAGGPALCLDALLRRTAGTGALSLRVRLGATSTASTFMTGVTSTPLRIMAVVGMRTAANTYFVVLTAGATTFFSDWVDATLVPSASMALTLDGNPATGNDGWVIEYSSLRYIPN
jgi:hypothetical protein